MKRASNRCIPIGRTLLFALLALPMVSVPTFAQDEQMDLDERASVRFGLYGHLLFAQHHSAFTRLPGVPNCCREFTGGGGVGFDVGGLVQYGLSDRLELEGRIGFLRFDGALREAEETTVIIGGVPTPGAFEHQLDPVFSAVELSPNLLWRPFDSPLRLHLFSSIGVLLSGSFEQREELVLPTDVGVFENNRRVRNEQSGEVPDLVSTMLSSGFGLSYELPLNGDGTMTVAPEISYEFGLSNHVADSAWRTDLFSIGAVLRYGRRRIEQDSLLTAEPPIAHDTLSLDTIPLRSVSASIEAIGLDERGQETELPVLRVEEFISTNLRPLLTYVFFDENIHVLPKRYVQISSEATRAFAVDRLHSVPVLPTYHHVLNIVGKRMRENPPEVVELVGTNDGLGEKLGDGRELSARRARAVRAYLMRTWGIDSSRLPISLRDLPDLPSNVRREDGIAENRRVELRSDSWEIVKPVVTLDTLRLTNPPSIRIDLSTDVVGPLNSWTVRVVQGERVVRTFSSEEWDQQELPKEIVWNLARDQQHVPRLDEPVTFELTVVDTSGQVGVAVPDTLQVRQITVSEKRREERNDKYIDRYSLILFEFDSSNLGPLNERIATFIEGRILPTSSVEIVGQTDRIGELDHNFGLSRRRAFSTSRALGLPDSTATGEGENTEIYDNDLPEGRFYSRTVRILVETPIPGRSASDSIDIQEKLEE